MDANRPPDLARTVFQLLAIGALIGSSFWILRPFLVALTWATTIVITSWPILLRVQGWFGGRRPLAVAVMTVALLLILVVPLYFAVSTIVTNARTMAGWAKSMKSLSLPPPPDWVANLPLVGSRLVGRWQQLAAARTEDLSARLAPFAHALVIWFVSQIGNVGQLLLQFLLTVIIAALLYANGETAAGGVDRFARRLAGPRGENALHLGAQAVRAVAMGVVVTAVVQSALSGIGLVVAGVPFAAVLTALMFILAVAQIGPVPILIAAVVWVYNRSGAAWGTGFLVWAVFCGLIDNFLRPFLISGPTQIPFILVFFGVVGGLAGLGLVGTFVGPVLLAVGFAVLAEFPTRYRPAE